MTPDERARVPKFGIPDLSVNPKAHPLVQWFVKIRKAKGLSQRDVADLTRLADSTVSDMEVNRGRIHLDTLELCLAAVGAKLSVQMAPKPRQDALQGATGADTGKPPEGTPRFYLNTGNGT